MGYNRDNGEPQAPAARKSRSQRIRHFILFAALPVGLGALAVAVTLSLPGSADDSLRDVFTAAYINGVAATTVAGVLQMWFTMGETQRANYEQARADAKQTEIDELRILLAERRNASVSIADARAAVAEARANFNLLREERADVDASDPKRAEYIARLDAEILHAAGNLNSALTILYQLLTGRSNGQQPE